MRRKDQQKISTDQESDDQVQMDCSCQILNDTNLQDVSDSDCSCTQCLQANLDAFNQLKDLEQRQIPKQARSLGKIPSRVNKKSQQQDIQGNKLENLNRYNRNSNLSLNRKTVKKSHLMNGEQSNSRADQNQVPNQRSKLFTAQNINDYILITKQRTRQFMKQRKMSENQNKRQQQELKQKIKQNLEILKYTVKAIEENDQQKQGDQQIQDSKIGDKKYQWNHKPFVISQQVQERKHNKHECKKKISQRKKRVKVDTNLQRLVPEFQSNPTSFLQQAKQKRLEKFKQCKGCPYDNCPNHHMRTSKSKLIKIQKFIKQQVVKHNKQKKNQKLKKQQTEKVKKAKLRAINLKSKQILAKSKKYDPSDSRTSFHLSIDHFSTFSELKENKKQKDQEKQNKKQIQKMMKQKGGKLQQAIYEDVFGEQHAFQQTKTIPILSKQISHVEIIKKPYCQKITKQAKIYSPRKLKAQDQQHKKTTNNKAKNKLNSQEQKKKTRQIQLQIQKKKRELMEQYKRQKQLKEVKNQKLGKSYKATIEGKK